MEYTVEEKELLERIGKKLREMRINAGYASHEHFSMDAHISRTQYFRYEKGESNLTVITLTKILKAHKVSLEDFFKNL